MFKTILIEDIALAYHEINTNVSKTIFFIHGNSSSHKTWANQLASTALANYRLIAFDLPAHGESSPSPTPDEHYGLSDLGRIIGKAINSLILNNHYIVVGFSLGANTICEALPDIKPIGIVLVGPSIVGQDYSFSSISLPNENTQVLFMEGAKPALVYAFYESCISIKKPGLLPEQIEDYSRVCSPFRSVLFQQTMFAGRVKDELNLLKSCGLPVCIIFGEEEKIINPDYLDGADINIWKNAIFKIPKAGHLVYLDQPEEFNDLLASYATEQFKAFRV